MHNLPKLKRKHATLRSNITRFVTAINDATEQNTPDILEHFRDHLQETSLNDSSHGSLNDVEYATDVEACKVCIDSAKRAINKKHAQMTLEYRLLCPLHASPPLRFPPIHP